MPLVAWMIPPGRSREDGPVVMIPLLDVLVFLICSLEANLACNRCRCSSPCCCWCCVCEFKPHELANMAWSFATACQLCEKIFAALAMAVERRVSDLNAQARANSAWSFATAHWLDEKLFPVLARAAERRVGECKPQGLANTAGAFATAGQLDEKLFAALARAAERRASEFNVRELANTAWAFATAGQLVEKLFAVLARAAERCGSEFKPQDLAGIGYKRRPATVSVGLLVVACLSDRDLPTALSRRLEICAHLLLFLAAAYHCLLGPSGVCGKFEGLLRLSAQTLARHR